MSPTSNLQPPTSRAPRGQGLLETIVAISVITVGVLSTITLVSASLGASKEGADRLVASNLAREGVEVARSIRDSNWLAGKDWSSGLVGLAGDRSAVPLFNPQNADWKLDFSATDLQSELAAVYQSDGLYLQGQSSGALSPYRRLIHLYPICRDENTKSEMVQASDTAFCPPPLKEIGLDIRAAVSWRAKGGTRSVIAEEKIYDWR